MSLNRAQLGLRLGEVLPEPAPGELMRALRGVEVTQSDSAPSGFQLTFHVETGAPGPFRLGADSRLRPMSRVIVRVNVDGLATTILDGFITHQQFSPGDGPDDATFVVTGEDVSVRMDQEEMANEFPAYNDSLMAEEILAGWEVLGIIPEVVPVPSAEIASIDHVSQQWETSRATLQRLAERNGCVFFVRPGLLPLTNTGYWGPPPRDAPPAAVLNVGVGPASNVESFLATYDALVATRYAGGVIDTDQLPTPVPIVTLAGMREPVLATRPSLTAFGGEGRLRLWSNADPANPQRSPHTQPMAAEDAEAALLQAQAMTDRSTDAVLRAQVDIDVTRLGCVLFAPGVVAVRGAGRDHDGLYYLQSATHRIQLVSGEQWGYRQSLVLTREGLGSTVAWVGA